MSLLTLPKTIQNLLVVGPTYNKLDKLEEVKKLIPEFDWVILNGSNCSDINIDFINSLLETNKVVYNVGKAELLWAQSLDITDPQQARIEKWVRAQPNVVIADFNGGYRIIIVDGGIPSHLTKLEQLDNNMEVSFAPHSHDTYSGGLGYVVCNTPLTPWAPRFHRYSVQIGNIPSGQVYALKINRHGVQRTILV